MSYRENYKLIDFSQEIVIPQKVRPQPKRSHLPCPRIASDHMEPVQSQLDGKMYESKSALRATYRAAGVIEVGNDPARLRPRKKKPIDDKAIADTVDKAVAKFNRGERVSR
ncbi:hypothetical protein HNQ36_001081 [Afipia massiliensis]|uniref:Uncharacterized protein n=1 Tax=Afipia massiliensis TaxID=211460 RepID=A0A840MY63_9BRAD|nr:hypothetical protein [Afipia massiliensis]MBB5051127.1 hypothetical protein [Afipia massiliensis]